MMGRGGIAHLVEWVLSVVGGVAGSLALATVASELFGSMSAQRRLRRGDRPADAGADQARLGSLIASCDIATIIPPSITMIIYGVAAQENRWRSCSSPASCRAC